MKKNYIICIFAICTIVLFFASYSFSRYKKANQYAEDMQYYFDTVLANNAYMSELPTESSINIYVDKSKKCKNDTEFLNLLIEANELFGDAGHLQPLTPDAYYSRLYTYEMAIEDGYFEKNDTLYTDLNQTDILKEYDSISKDFECDKEQIKDYMDQDSDQKPIKDNLTFTNIYGTLIIGIKSLGLEYCKQDMETIQRKLENFNGNRIIFDLRDNYGGADLYWYDLVTMTSFDDYKFRVETYGHGNILAGYLRNNNTDFEVKMKDDEIVLSEEIELRSRHIFDYDNIYIISNGNTGSSSDSFVKFAKQTGYATVVGTETSGSGGGGLSPLTFELPNTHLAILLESTTTKPRKTEPDINIYSSVMKDYIDKIKEHENINR